MKTDSDLRIIHNALTRYHSVLNREHASYPTPANNAYRAQVQRLADETCARIARTDEPQPICCDVATIARLKAKIDQMPDDSIWYAYEGENTGINVLHKDGLCEFIEDKGEPNLRQLKEFLHSQ